MTRALLIAATLASLLPRLLLDPKKIYPRNREQRSTRWLRRQPTGGRIVDSPVHISDWAATLLTSAGAAPADEQQLDGIDVWPLLRGAVEQLPTRTLYWRFPQHAALRQDGWKLITDRQHQHPALFNLAEDPYEQHDLADQNPQRLQSLIGLLDQYRAGDWSNERAGSGSRHPGPAAAAVGVR